MNEREIHQDGRLPGLQRGRQTLIPHGQAPGPRIITYWRFCWASSITETPGPYDVCKEAQLPPAATKPNTISEQPLSLQLLLKIKLPSFAATKGASRLQTFFFFFTISKSDFCSVLEPATKFKNKKNPSGFGGACVQISAMLCTHHLAFLHLLFCRPLLALQRLLHSRAEFVVSKICVLYGSADITYHPPQWNEKFSSAASVLLQPTETGVTCMVPRQCSPMYRHWHLKNTI